MSWFLDPYWSPLASWLEALGTIGAVLVALFYPVLREWLNRPIIEIEYDNEEPFCRRANVPIDVPDPDSGHRHYMTAYYIRLRIQNIGKSVALNCEGKLNSIRFRDNNENFTPFDPVVLSWVGHHPGSIMINRDEYEYLNIISVFKDVPDRLQISAEDFSPRGIDFHPQMNDYVLQISVYGENFSPKHTSFILHSSEEYDQVTLTRA